MGLTGKFSYEISIDKYYVLVHDLLGKSLRKQYEVGTDIDEFNP